MARQAQNIKAVAAIDEGIAAAERDGVVAVASINFVVAATAIDIVVAAASDKHVTILRPEDGVVATQHVGDETGHIAGAREAGHGGHRQLQLADLEGLDATGILRIGCQSPGIDIAVAVIPEAVALVDVGAAIGGNRDLRAVLQIGLPGPFWLVQEICANRYDDFCHKYLQLQA